MWLGVVLLLGSVARAWGQAPPSFLRQNAVILFEGDSITDGGRWREGSDFNHIMGQDYAYVIAAELGSEYPERNARFINKGVGSSQVTGMAERWETDVLASKPDVLSILIGVNDALMTGDKVESVATYEATYDRLLAETLKALPGVTIVLGEPFVLPVGKQKEVYAASLTAVKLRQAVVARLGAKYHLPVIDYQKVFDEACARAPAAFWSWDGVHPTYAGHGLMAREWMRVMGGG